MIAGESARPIDSKFSANILRYIIAKRGIKPRNVPFSVIFCYCFLFEIIIFARIHFCPELLRMQVSLCQNLPGCMILRFQNSFVWTNYKPTGSVFLSFRMSRFGSLNPYL